VATADELDAWWEVLNDDLVSVNASDMLACPVWQLANDAITDRWIHVMHRDTETMSFLNRDQADVADGFCILAGFLKELHVGSIL
jgi:hypothetical protein